MSEFNIKKLKNAYRHPFEYISPLLYRKKTKTSSNEDDEQELRTAQLFVADEEEFNRLSVMPSIK